MPLWLSSPASRTPRWAVGSTSARPHSSRWARRRISRAQRRSASADLGAGPSTAGGGGGLPVSAGEGAAECAADTDGSDAGECAAFSATSAAAHASDRARMRSPMTSPPCSMTGVVVSRSGWTYGARYSCTVSGARVIQWFTVTSRRCCQVGSTSSIDARRMSSRLHRPSQGVDGGSHRHILVVPTTEAPPSRGRDAGAPRGVPGCADNAPPTILRCSPDWTRTTCQPSLSHWTRPAEMADLTHRRNHCSSWGGGAMPIRPAVHPPAYLHRADPKMSTANCTKHHSHR